MKKSVRTQLIILGIIVGISIFSFIPAGLSWRGHNRGVRYRPITDWTDVNPFGIGPDWYTGYVGGDYRGNHYWTWIDSLKSHFFLFDWVNFEPPTEYAYEFDGYVKEKLRHDGSLEFTIKLMVKNMYAEVAEALRDENGDPIWTIDYFGGHGQYVWDGFIDYYFEFKFILDAEFIGFTGSIFPQALQTFWPIQFDIPGGTREQGCVLPPLYAFLFFPAELGIHVKSLKFMAFGSGNVYAPGIFVFDPVVYIGTADILFFHYAKFKPGENINWPYGHSGFKINYIRLYNIEYF
jgi:hypothetical protein